MFFFDKISAPTASILMKFTEDSYRCINFGGSILLLYIKAMPEILLLDFMKTGFFPCDS